MSRSVALAVLVVGQAVGHSAEPTIHLAPIVPPSVRLLSHPSVSEDVGLSPVQNKAIEAMQAAWDAPSHVWVDASLFWITPEIARTVIDRHTQDFLTKDLTAAQRKRLDQIAFQLKEREFGARAAFAMTASELGLCADQLEDLHNLNDLRVAEIAKHVTSGERYEKMKGKVELSNTDAYEKMTEMLSRVQRKKLSDLKAKPFAGKLDFSTSRSEPIPPASKRVKDLGEKGVYPQQLFGVYDFEIRYLESYTIRCELNLHSSYTTIIRELSLWEERFRSLSGSYVEKVTKMHEHTNKVLNDILEPSRRKRFDELMMQRRRTKGGWNAVCGYPTVAAAVKMTPTQLSQLKNGLSVSEVLSAVQRETLWKLAGEPFSVSTYITDPVVGPNWGGSKDESAGRHPASAIGFLSASERLKLNAEQSRTLREIADDEPKILELIRKELGFSDGAPIVGSNANITAAGTVTDRYQVAAEEQCWNVLDAAQQSLARQIFGHRK